jgi:hypothetical protein
MSDVLLAGRYCNGAPTGQHIVLFRLVLFFHSCAKSEALSKVCFAIWRALLRAATSRRKNAKIKRLRSYGL